MVSLAFTGLLAPWATGAETDEVTTPDELIAAVEGSETTLTTASGEEVPATEAESEDSSPDAPPADEQPADAKSDDGPPADDSAGDEPATDQTDEGADGDPAPAVDPPKTEARTSSGPIQLFPTETIDPNEGVVGLNAPDAGGIVPLATSSTMNVTVRKRVYANPTSLTGNVAGTIGTNYADTPGARFRLFTYTNYNAGPQSSTDYTCEITGGGQCTIVIPQADAQNQGRRFWVVEEAPVPGSPADRTFINPHLLVGSYDGPTYVRNIVGVTKAVAANTDIVMPLTANGNNGGTVIANGDLGGNVTTALGASFGATVNSLKNPAVAAKCDAEKLRIALVLDQSASIQTGQWTTFRNALVNTNDGVLKLLRDEGALVSILGFGSNVSGQNGWHHGGAAPAVIPSTDTAMQNLIPTNRPGGSGNATNWDAALSQIQSVNDTHNFDIVLFITDGAPNYILDGSGPGGQPSGASVTLRSLEAPIYAANAIKNDGTRLVAVGVGNGVSGAGVNLRAVSGETLNSDYFQTLNWDDLKDDLRDIVKGATCQIPVEVSKTIVPASGAPVTDAGGWQFTAGHSGTGSSLVGTPSQTTTLGVPGNNGRAEWDVRFTQPTGQTADITLTETLQDGWDLTDVSCTVAGVPRPVTITGGNQVTISGLTTSSEKVFCVFENTEVKTAKLTLVKVVTNDNGGTALPTAWTLSAEGPTPISGVTGSTNVTQAVVEAGAYVLSESDGPAGYAASAWSCPGATLTGSTVTVPAGGDVTCTIVNDDQPGKLTLVKEVINDNGGTALPTAWTLNAQGPTPISGATGSPAVTAATVNAGAYVLSESAGPAGYTASAWSCPGATLNGSTVTVPLGGDVTCTIVNDDQPGKLTLVKEVINDNGGTAEPEDWTLNAQGPTSISGATGSPAVTAATVNAGAYVLSESDGPAGYTASAWSCPGATLNGSTVTVPLGGDVTCTIVNDDQPGKLTLVKEVINDNGGTAEPEDWTLNAQGPTSISGASGTSAVTAAPVSAGAYVLSETDGPAGYTAGGWSCDGGTLNGSTVTVPLGGDVTCTIINDDVLIPVTVTKSDGTVTQLANGTWQIDYTITVTNQHQSVGTTYTLTDTPQLGDGWDLVSGVWVVGPSPVTNTPIAANSSHNYTYRIVADLDDQEPDTSLVCEPGEGGAFYNLASITFPGGSDSDTGCAQPAAPTVTKTGAAAVQNSNGTWNLTYTIVVSNGTGIQLAYDLQDTVAALPTGLSATSWTATGPVYANGTSADEGTLATPDWNGSGALATGVISNDATHTYTVTGIVTVAPNAPSASLQCTGVPGQGGGVWNTATVTNGVGGDEDSDCIPVTPPPVQIDKTEVSTHQLDDGLWRITYEIDVTNNHANLATRYNLNDTITFGGGLTPVSAVATLSGGAQVAIWDDLPTTLTENLATNMLIGAGITHTYVVVVDADVETNVTGTSAAQCSGDEGTGGGGFLNVANVTFPGGTDEDAACSEPEVPHVSKSFVSAGQNDDGTWTVRYTIGVNNPTNDQQLSYNLSDQPGFPTGVTINRWTVTAGTGTPAVSPAIDGDYEAPGTIATERLIAAGATHTYNVVFNLNISAGLPDGAEECLPNSVPGSGLFNQATLTSGNDTMTDDICEPFQEVGVPSIAKTVTGISQGADGSWTITYALVVTSNPDFVTTYDLTDTLRFGAGATINSADWEWTNDPGDPNESGSWTDPVDTNRSTIIATNRVLAKGVGITHTYTVTVNADVPQASIGTADMDCVIGQGESGSGFMNQATLKSGDYLSTVQACDVPTKPVIEKEAVGAATQQANGSWNVSYTITVDNTDGVATFYDLGDTPAFAPDVTINNWTVTAGAGTPAVNPAINGATWTGPTGTIGTAVPLAAGASHSYTVTFNVSIAPDIASEDRECLGQSGGAGQGLFNEALLTIADGTDRDDDCVDIPQIGTPTVAKTLGTVTQGTDGMWTVTYNVVVTGHATQVTTYTLNDTLDFGAGATIDSASWVWTDHPGTVPPAASGTWADPGTNPTTALATNQLLPAGATDTFTVTVVVDVAAGTIGTTPMECGSTQEGPTSTGFLNTVDLYVGGTLVDDDHACGEPATPSFTKTAVGLSDNGDGTWDAVYTLTVTSNATGGQTIVYDLTDTPALPAAVTVVGARVANTTPGTIATNPDWGDAGEDTIVTGQSLTAGTSHVYTVTLTVEFTGLMTPAERDCVLVEGEPASGLLNVSSLSSGNDDYPGQDCLPIPDPTFNVAKQVASAVQLDDGTWQIVYTVTVNNTSSIPGTYLLTDTLAYGAGLTPTSASWSLAAPAASGSWDLTAGNTTTLANYDRGLSGGASHVYTVTVIATVAGGTSLPTSAVCSGDDGTSGGGFLNTVALTFPGGTDNDAACEDPTVPEISKTYQSLTQNADTSWTVTYDLVVDNTSGKDSFYSLADVPGFAGDVTILDWTVTAQAGTPAVDPAISGVVWATPGTIATDVAIDEGDTHTYRVAFRVSIPAGLSSADRECDAEATEGGQGLFNEAQLSSGDQTRDDDDCVDIPEIGIPSITKTVASVAQQANGTWLVTYNVVVTANATNHSRYDLSDTIQFGDAATVNSASWTWSNAPAGTAPADAAGSWTTPVGENLTTTIATDRLIPAGSSQHIYTVSVVAALSQSAIDTPVMDCQLGDGEEGTGFLNSATLTSGLVTDTDEDCATPTEPTIAKHGAAIAQQADASWNVTYTITVDNTGGHATVYDLTDTPSFPAEVTINNWTVVASGLPEPLIDGAYTDGEIVIGRVLPADAVHTYQVTFNVYVAVSISGEALECALEGDQEGHGYFNTALMEIGDGGYTDDDCIDIPEPGIPSVAKTLGTVTQGTDGLWTVTYSITVTGDDEWLTRYDLTDDLRFGGDADIVSAAWTWDDAPEGTPAAQASGTWADPATNSSATLAVQRVIEVDGTDVYTVTVVVDVATGAVGTPGMTCDPEGGSEVGNGFLNQTDLWVGEDWVDSDDACGEPAAPQFTKTALELVANGDGTYDAVYELRVTSDATEGQIVNYDLSDTPVLPAQVELVGRTVTSSDVTVDPAWDDETTDVIVAGQAIEQDGEHVFTVTLTIRIIAPMTLDERDCELTEGEESTGLLNVGTVTSGNDDHTDSDCLELPDPDFEVVKAAGGATETAVGVWEVIYTVTVTNTSDIPGTYSLTDTLDYGAGITPTAATWSRDGASGTFDLTSGTSAVLATDVALAAGASHVYTVTVTADVAPGVANTPAGACEAEGLDESGGFLNTAELTWDNETRNSEACEEVYLNYGSLQVTKALTGATAGFTGGINEVFNMQWSCEAPDGTKLTGSAMVAVGRTVTLSDEIPVGSICSITETTPSGNLALLHRWLAPSYSASSVTPTIESPVVGVTVTNEIVRDPDPRPELPAAGLDDGQQGILNMVVMLAALGAAGALWTRRRKEA